MNKQKKTLNKQEVKKIIEELHVTYPEAKCELNYRTPFQLLIATVLSAQTTDQKVNQVTKHLFEEFPDLDGFINISEEELRDKIKVIGLHKTKAKNIKRMCYMLNQDYNGEVPNNYEDLMKLPGVGRKTANVVLSNAFNVPAIAVDTHVFRVSNRIGLVNEDNVLKTELKLQSVIPKEKWSIAHHLLIWHGRRRCKARKPLCEECLINDICMYYNAKKSGD